MLLSKREARFCRLLRDFPFQHDLRYSKEAERAFKQILFRFLTADNETFLRDLFGGQVPVESEPWNLSQAQGVAEEREYTEAARGKPCGHIFKSGDCVFRCKTCTADDTACMCTRCFEASDHTGHTITQSISIGNTGCCDCGDDEAWIRPVQCAIHSIHDTEMVAEASDGARLPEELADSIRMTIGRAMDYVLDVISCSPENLRLSKSEESIRRDEEYSRLASAWYEEVEDKDPEFALILWNDEKHTIIEVEEQVKRACRERRTFGRQKADEANDIGRTVVRYSKNVRDLLRIAAIIEQIKITVTIRSSRDTFRERMCGAIIDFFNDLIGCSVEGDHDFLTRVIGEQLLRPWRLGSKGSNKDIGRSELDDHEIEDQEAEKTQRVIFRRGNAVNFARRLTREDSESENEDDGDENDGDESPLSRFEGNILDSEVMDVDVIVERAPVATEPFDLGAPDDMEDGTEVSEATLAGYPPPPPPPPPAPPQVAPLFGGGDSPIEEDPRGATIGASISFDPFASRTNIDIPMNPKSPRRRTRTRPPDYWLQQPEQKNRGHPLPPEEDLRRHIRLDWLLLYDLRLWKKVRIDLRDLYISSILNNNETRRLFGLRFAGLYGVLGQLFLIADREPDLSIINLSVQIFTVPSVTEEVIQKTNFLTTLFSMLYTFLTQRSVLQPCQVSIEDSMASENHAVSNRRMYHFFADLRYMFGSQYVQCELHTKERYQLQFLDLIRLPQGICPNNRFIGDHVEYENDAWISAQFLAKEVNKLIRQVAETFHNRDTQLDDGKLCNIIRLAGKAVVINSMGSERVRFDQAEIKFETQFKTLGPFYFERVTGKLGSHFVVNFVVEREAISFHHPLHNFLSWLIECGKTMTAEKVKALLCFSLQELRQPPPYKVLVPDRNSEDYLMAAFDFPLRVCAWLAQMKAGMWVRNGLSLRHQMNTYRSFAHRDLTHHRDIFLLQTALVICDPHRVLASMIDRFGMEDWMTGHYSIRDGAEVSQQIDIAEDFIHLFIVLLCDRTSLFPYDDAENNRIAAIRRDIAHVLCFKPLSFSDLDSRFSEKPIDLEDYQEILNSMTNFKPPEGLSDTGTFELKSEHYEDLDPFAAHYTKNQRDEAENAYRNYVSKRYGTPTSEVVYEPQLPPINTGVFVNLSLFTSTPLFAQICFHSLGVGSPSQSLSDIPQTRIESFIRTVLHLVLVAVLEADAVTQHILPQSSDKTPSFITHVLQTRSELGLTIFDLLVKLLESGKMKTCQALIRRILLRVKQKDPEKYKIAISQYMGDGISGDLENIDSNIPMTPEDREEEVQLREARQLKKRQALARQAKVMAQFQQQQQNFLENQEMVDWDEADESTLSGSLSDQKRIWKFPSGNCILCQEETNDLYGTFGMMMNSSIFRETDTHDREIMSEVLNSPENFDVSCDQLRPFGIAGANRSKTIRRSATGDETEVEHQGLAKGFPRKFVGRGPVSTGCGHIMHYTCFETYCAATDRRQDHQIARQHPERPRLKEFVCPLCKALGNAFLPIIWKGKEETSFSRLRAETSYQVWLSEQIGPTSANCRTAEEGQPIEERLRARLRTYVLDMIVPSLSTSSGSGPSGSVASPISPQPSSRSSWLAALPGLWHAEHEGPSPSDRFVPDESAMTYEASRIYSRLKETINSNDLSPRHSGSKDPHEGLAARFTNIETLTRVLGHSITTAEIAQRGSNAEHDLTILDKIPTSLLTHLRILCETVSSFTAVEVINGQDSGLALPEFIETGRRQLLQLFQGEHRIEIGTAPALTQDPFNFLTEITFAAATTFELDIGHLLRSCYALEIVKASMCLILATRHDNGLSNDGKISGDVQISKDVSQSLHSYVRWIFDHCLPDDYSMESGETLRLDPDQFNISQWASSFLKALTRYALVFLRKAAILMHVRYGMSFSDVDVVGQGDSELERLSNILHVPSISRFMNSVGGQGDAADTATQALVKGWISHWHVVQGHTKAGTSLLLSEMEKVCSQSAYQSLRLGHPVIFELIGLPKHFDTLTYEATRRRCPTKGNKMEDPSLCLFCGEFFCGQALCCTKFGKGGCFQHMRK